MRVHKLSQRHTPRLTQGDREAIKHITGSLSNWTRHFYDKSHEDNINITTINWIWFYFNLILLMLNQMYQKLNGGFTFMKK